MAVNKYASIRYNVLDKCFGNRFRNYTFADLLAHVDAALQEIDSSHIGISVRTLRDDIRHMRSPEGWNAPIKVFKERGISFYRYEDIEFSISKQPLNQAEIGQLKTAIETLSRIQGLPQFNWIPELTTKLEQSFVLEKGNNEIIGFDNNEYLKGIEYLGNLFQFILNRQPLCIKYHPFTSPEPFEYIIHPYYLKQYNNRWFLFGLNPHLMKISTLALDRIRNISAESIPYIDNTNFDFKEYFEDIIGVSLIEGEQLQNIVLSFNRKAAPYVESKPLHGSQKIVSRSDNELVIAIEVVPNYELESVILSFGERARVLEPLYFKQKIEARLKETLEGYKL